MLQNRNPGIKYEYLLPINTLPTSSRSDEIVRSVEMEADMPPASSMNNESDNKANSDAENTSKAIIEKRKKKHLYVWRVVSFTSCSKSCGGGSLTPIIRCVREGTSKFYAHKRCAHQIKPVLDEHVLKCNSQPCPAYWEVEDWSACNCGLPNEHEHQTRNSKCVQELSSGIVIAVNDGACLENQPENRQECNCPKQQVGYYRNPLRRNHREKYNHSSSITLIGNSTIGKKAHMLDSKKTGNWLTSDWNEQVKSIIILHSFHASNVSSLFILTVFNEMW